MDAFHLESPLDMHLHLREGDMLRLVAPLSARTFAGAVIMPNLVPPVDNAARLDDYRSAVMEAVGGEVFEPYMTLFFRPYTMDELEAMRPRIIGIKLYPAGATTNSEAGVRELREAEATLEVMQDLDIPLMVHGESGGFVLDREAEFIDVFDRLARRFPRLRIVMEHITTRQAAAFLDRYANVFATVTLHHLVLTLDDVAGGLLAPHLFCKPIPKRQEDRDALLAAALSAHPKLMFGSDSAPHPRHDKECSGCAAGVFTAPIALAMLVELFERQGALENLQAFVSGNARRVYGLNPLPKSVAFVKEPAVVPSQYGEVVPFGAGRTVGWRLCESTESHADGRQVTV
ncbi:MAG: dihydroorotase [Candidatus Tectomicrobia bacterium]|nr:dihydroorotase [Candidatus Tectomicrobia bacterium]